MKPIGLDNIADGVASELFMHELDKVAANIVDQNAGATAKRSITLTFSFAPDEDREEVKVTVSAKTSLAPIKSYTKTSYVGKKNSKPALFSGDTKQIDMFDNGVSKIEKKEKAGHA